MLQKWDVGACLNPGLKEFLPQPVASAGNRVCGHLRSVWRSERSRKQYLQARLRSSMLRKWLAIGPDMTVPQGGPDRKP